MYLLKWKDFGNAQQKKMTLQFLFQEFLTQKLPETAMSIVLSGFYSNNETALCVEVELWS